MKSKNLVKKKKEKVIYKKLEETESKHTDVSKCFETDPLLKRKKPKKKLVVYNGNGDMFNTEKPQTDEITNIFREIFETDNQGTAKECPPCSLVKSFTEEEFNIVSKKLKNAKSPNKGKGNAEYIKYALPLTHQIIADILSKNVKTVNYLEVLKKGLHLYENPP